MNKPQIGKWFPLTESGCVCASGQPYYGALRLGTENNLIVYFDGGGGSWNKETAAKSVSASLEGSLYVDVLGDISDMDYRSGVCSREDWNPFRNWTIININYATGDLHVGNNDFSYEDTNGQEKILYHHGYRNFHMVMEQAVKYIDIPDKLLIAGASAGGFGVAALAGEVADMFPSCKDVTCLVDGTMILADWVPILRDVWNAPEKFWKVIRSDNVVADWMYVLNQEKRFKWLFISSVRDAVVSAYQNVFDGQGYNYSKEGGIKYQKNLEKMCKQWKFEMPDVGIYIYDYPANGFPEELELTQHTISLWENMKEKLEDDVSPMEWLWNAVWGKLDSCGWKLFECGRCMK